MKTYQQVIESFGLKCETLTPDKRCWEGDGIIRSNTDSNFLHELAHWQVSAPERRSLPNFGLGSCPDEHISTDMIVKQSQANEEEKLASCLGILWERKLGLNWVDTYFDHYWHDGIDIPKRTGVRYGYYLSDLLKAESGEWGFGTSAKKLMEMGLISPKYVPYNKPKVKHESKKYNNCN